MDLATAKTLVSLALVLAITLFSLISFRAMVSAVMSDLRAVPVRARRAPDRSARRLPR